MVTKRIEFTSSFLLFLNISLNVYLKGDNMVTIYAKDFERIKSQRKNWYTEYENPEEFVDFKINMLVNEMFIEPTEDEIAHLRSLTTETAINNAVRSIVARHWSNF